MRIYRDMLEALAYANKEGGQALYLDSQLGVGHLIDQDIDRLAETARSLGVRDLAVVGIWSPRQRAMIKGPALKRAIELAEDTA